MNYRPDIDALRGIAVLSVILFHLGFSPISGGFVGVDIFFVISGYVIAKSLEEDLHHNKFSILKFYNKRIRRIFPALFATFLMTYIAGYFLILPHFFEKFSQSLISSALFVSNIFFWKDSGYFSADALTRPLLHTWSLSVEEQYYIFYPLLTYAVYHFFGKRWFTVLFPLFIGSLALSIYATSIAPTANFFLSPTRAWELLTGALLAHTALPIIQQRWQKESMSLIGALLLAYPIFFFHDDTPFPGLNALYPCLGAAAIIYAGQSSARSIILKIFSNKPLVWIGLISYSLYLIHWPVIVFFYFVNLAPPTALQSAIILVSVFSLAYLSWRYVEQPFRAIDPTPKRKILIAMGLAGITVACLAGYAGMATKGFASRYPDFKYEKDNTSNMWRLGTCFFEKNPDKNLWDYKQCQITNNGTETVLLWGDSFAAHYTQGILALSKDIPYTVVQYTAAGCPPILSYYSYANNARGGTHNKACTPFNAGALDIIKEHHITKVILSGRWSNLKSRGLDGLSDTIATLKKMGVTVYVIGQSPEFPIDVQILAYMKGAKSPDATDKWSIHFDSDINDRLAALAKDVIFIDPMTSLCDGNMCTYRENGKMLFSDYGHYSEDGSIRAVKSYFPLYTRTN